MPYDPPSSNPIHARHAIHVHATDKNLGRHRCATLRYLRGSSTTILGRAHQQAKRHAFYTYHRKGTTLSCVGIGEYVAFRPNALRSERKPSPSSRSLFSVTGHTATTDTSVVWRNRKRPKQLVANPRAPIRRGVRMPLMLAVGAGRRDGWEDRARSRTHI